MSSASAYLAATAVRGQSLLVFYRTPTSSLGTLFLISANPPDNLPVSPTLPPLTSPLYVEAQTLLQSDLGLPSLAQISLQGISMVSTSMLDPQTNDFRHDILLALNQVQSRPLSPFPQEALVLRLAPQSPNTGDGQFARNSVTGGSNRSNSPTWRVTDASLSQGLVPRGAKSIWLSSGTVSTTTMDPRVDGSAIIQLAATTATVPSLSSSFIATKLDVSNGITNGAVVPSTWVHNDVFFDANVADPQIISLSKGSSQGIVAESIAIGACRSTMTTSNRNACLAFLSSAETLMGVAPIEYGPTSCFAEGDGEVLLVSPDQIWSMSLTTQRVSSRLPPSFAPYLPSPILACNKIGSNLYVVLQGNDTMPVIQTLDISKPQWNWKKTQLFSVPTPSNQSKPPANGSNNAEGSSKSSGLSSGAIAGISIAAVLVLLAGLGAAFFFYRKKHRKQQDDRGGAGKLDNTATANPEQSPGFGYTPVYTAPQVGSPNVSVPMAAPAYMLASSSPGNTSISRNGSMEPEKHELSQYSPPLTTFQHQPISQAWSNDGLVAPVPYTTASNNSYPITSAAGPYSAYPVSHGPGNSSHTVLSAPPATPQYSLAALSPVSLPGAIIGDKQEVTEEDSSDSGNTVPDGRDGMFSPTLANAQLILQQSQTPAVMTQPMAPVPMSQPPLQSAHVFMPPHQQQMPYRPHHG